MIKVLTPLLLLCSAILALSAPLFESIGQLRIAIEADSSAIEQAADDLRNRTLQADRKPVIIKESEYKKRNVGAALLALRPHFIIIDTFCTILSVDVPNSITQVVIYDEKGIRPLKKEEIDWLINKMGAIPHQEAVMERITIATFPPTELQ